MKKNKVVCHAVFFGKDPIPCVCFKTLEESLLFILKIQKEFNGSFYSSEITITRKARESAGAK